MTMPVPHSPDASKLEDDGESSEKPPPHDTPTPRPINTSHGATKSLTNGNSFSVPLPPPDSATYPKEPGHTVCSLEKLVLSGSEHMKQESGWPAAGSTPSTSPSVSESEWSGPSTSPPSHVPSRAPSMSEAVKPAKPEQTVKQTVEAQPSTTLTARRPSVHSDTGTKFSLKDLLNSGPKLARKSSARSTGSSRKSDSDGDRKSTAGDSTASLSKKYGVCQKVAIGKGATSVVRLAHKWDRSEEKLYAVKEFRKRKKNETEKEYVKKLTAEFCISSTLHHPNIVETVDLVQDEQKHWCEVMEFCPGGDLYAAIRKGGMSPSEVECCFKQMLSGVEYLHKQGVAHRDLKPENLFFDTKGHLKIGDYGASTVYRLPWESTVHMSTGLCGSEPYIAPEMFFGKPYDARLVDIWACGIIYYCLHFQELPWRVAQTSETLYGAYAAACASPQQAQSSCPPTINNLSPRACRPLMRKMLEPDPKQRHKIEEVINHPWVQGIEICYLAAKPAHVHVHARAMAEAQVHMPS